jgi:hypothetical protein
MPLAYRLPGFTAMSRPMSIEQFRQTLLCRGGVWLECMVGREHLA